MLYHRNDHPSDARLLASACAGDMDASLLLVERLMPVLQRTVGRLTGWHNDHEDIVQDVFLAIQSSGNSYRGDSTLETWATTIAINRCRRWMRDVKRNRHSEIDTDANALISIDADQTVKDDSEEVRRAIRCLKHEDRELVVLRYMEEMSSEQIAEMLGMRQNTVAVRLTRARKKLQRLLSHRLETK